MHYGTYNKKAKRKRIKRNKKITQKEVFELIFITTNDDQFTSMTLSAFIHGVSSRGTKAHAHVNKQVLCTHHEKPPGSKTPWELPGWQLKTRPGALREVLRTRYLTNPFKRSRVPCLTRR